ncbi:MFS transporter [Pseudonocardia sp. CA-142604]|uniref:MFS transporter n=1 Tax=Pseudonocardia sp. CA-142604 TaxID=3240024 RepID=UPI003D933E43
MTDTGPADLPARPAAALPVWAPLRHRVFRALWVAQFVANIGTWAQLVAAQWLMGDLIQSGLAVALVQTAMTLPVFLLVVPAGALGDIVDRRVLLFSGQFVMALAAGCLAAFTALGTVSPGLLLGLTAALGVGQALSVPSFQAVQPELVGRRNIEAAALLNGANGNLARAVGPALGGLLIAAAGPEAAFALNAASFIGVLAVLAAWRREVAPLALGAERLFTAVRTGGRYVRHAPLLRAVLAQTALFMIFGSAVWALLPVVARGPLQLGVGGYGLLLGGAGVGAVLGALVVPMVRTRVGPGVVVAASTLAYAAAVLVTGATRAVPLVAVAMVVTGIGWVAVISTLDARAQVLLPDWPRARALAYYQLVVMGGQALGGVLWGAIAEWWGTITAFTVAAAGLAATVPVARRFLPLAAAAPDLTTVQHLPEPPEVSFPRAGRVLVTVEWRVPTERAPDFVDAMVPVGRARRRTGARLWGLFRDVEDPECFLEAFTVADWTEHLRQHLERGTAMDRDAEEGARRLIAPGTAPRVRHLLWAARTRKS